MPKRGLFEIIETVDRQLSRITDIRVHGIALFLIGILLTPTLIFITFTLGNYLKELTLPFGMPLFCFTGVLSLFTLSFAGFGVVEIITGTPWKEARGFVPFLILVIVWISFFILLIGPRNLADIFF